MRDVSFSGGFAGVAGELAFWAGGSGYRGIVFRGRAGSCCVRGVRGRFGCACCFHGVRAYFVGFCKAFIFASTLWPSKLEKYEK